MLGKGCNEAACSGDGYFTVESEKRESLDGNLSLGNEVEHVEKLLISYLKCVHN